MPKLHLESITGLECLQYSEALAELRIQVFREWPYLYHGSIDYEQRYLQKYAACRNSILVIALDGERIVGVSTGLPMRQADADFQAAFNDYEFQLDSIFYLGESVLLPEYRGQGTGHRFFDLREAQARKCGAKFTAFCAVDRADDDPRRPADYQQLDSFWGKRGYSRHPNRKAIFDWREIGQTVDSKHSLSFWIKKL